MKARARVLAWIVTGPLGHLWSALVDMTLIWARWLTHRARRRVSSPRGRV